MSDKILEVCAGSFDDCVSAFQGNADRVELNSALSLGGLTPSLATLMKVKKEIGIETCCMVRPRPAGFNYNVSEFEIMFEDARLLLEAGADGIVFGFLNENFTIQKEYTRKMVELIHSFGKKAIFHRAFDLCENLESSIVDLIECHVDRILTSGGRSNVDEGIKNISNLQSHYGSRIEILAGCGIRVDNVKKILNMTHVTQIHSSCKGYVFDSTTRNAFVSYSYLENNHDCTYEAVDTNKVKMLKKVLNS